MSFKYLSFVSIVLLISSVTTKTFAQNHKDVTYQQRVQDYLTLKLKPKYFISSYIGNYWNYDKVVNKEFITNGAFNYNLRPGFQLGAGLIYASYHSTPAARKMELRPIQYFVYSKKMSFFNFSNRVRFEERFWHNYAEDLNTRTYRARERMTFSMPLTKWNDAHFIKAMSLSVADELFANVGNGSAWFNKNRFMVTPKFTFSKESSVALSCLLQTTAVTDMYVHHQTGAILWLKFYQNLHI